MRGITSISLAVFKKELEKFLKSVLDQSDCVAYNELRAAGINSLVDQVVHQKVWSETCPQGCWPLEHAAGR